MLFGVPGSQLLFYRLCGIGVRFNRVSLSGEGSVVRILYLAATASKGTGVMSGITLWLLSNVNSGGVARSEKGVIGVLETSFGTVDALVLGIFEELGELTIHLRDFYKRKSGSRGGVFV